MKLLRSSDSVNRTSVAVSLVAGLSLLVPVAVSAAGIYDAQGTYDWTWSVGPDVVVSVNEVTVVDEFLNTGSTSVDASGANVNSGMSTTAREAGTANTIGGELGRQRATAIWWAFENTDDNNSRTVELNVNVSLDVYAQSTSLDDIGFAFADFTIETLQGCSSPGTCGDGGIFASVFVTANSDDSSNRTDSYLYDFFVGPGQTALIKAQLNVAGVACANQLCEQTEPPELPQPPAVPIPGAVWLFGSGVLAIGAVARRRKQTA